MMRSRSIPVLGLLGIALASVLATIPALANNPIAVTSTGTPYKWNSLPIIYTVDGGNLGALSNDEANALTAQAFSAWTSVPTASLSVTQNPVIGLGSDGDVDTVADFNALFPSGPCPNFNAIIYDSGGALTDGLFGVGASNSTLGFTSPCLAATGDSILAMRVVLIVKSLTASSVTTLGRSQILGVFIHEFGHGLGLGHSQVNLNCQTNTGSCPSNTPGGDVFGIPTMYPFLLLQTEATNVSFQATLSTDDISAISTLYPSPAFAASFGTISGTVFFGDSINHFQGANVIARRVGDPRVTAVSNVSGMFAQVDHGNAAFNRSPSSRGSPDPIKRGEYTIPGLPPGTYTVEVETVSSTFPTSGTSVGPIQPQRGDSFAVPAAECFGGPESKTDNTSICQTLVLGAGNVLTNNSFILNDTLATMDAFDTAARNETIATATAIGAGTTNASISANNGPDVDVYAINVPAGQVLTVETFSRRLVPQGYLDSAIEITDAGGTRLTACRIGVNPTLYNQQCLDDDFSPSGIFTQDSKLAYGGSPGTVYLHVRDFLGDFRPDLFYRVVPSFAPATGEIVPPATPLSFDTKFVSEPPVTKSFAVTNLGVGDLILAAAPITIANAPQQNAFALASGSTCTGNLALSPGASCNVNVVFQATSFASYTGSFSVFSNAALSPHIFNLQGAVVDFSLSSAGLPSSQTVSAGQTASFSITFMRLPPSTALPAATTFTASGLPTGASASLSPSSFAAGSGSSIALITLTVSTNPRSAVVGPASRLPMPPLLFFTALLAATILSLLTALRRQLRVPAAVATCALLAIVCVFATLVACGGGGGGGSGTSGGGGSSLPGTPAGTYPLTVTATSGPVTRTTTVTLVVQ